MPDDLKMDSIKVINADHGLWRTNRKYPWRYVDFASFWHVDYTQNLSQYYFDQFINLKVTGYDTEKIIPVFYSKKPGSFDF